MKMIRSRNVEIMSDYFWSCDWGSSSFRLYLVNSETCEIVDKFESHNGITKLSKALSDEQDISEVSEVYLNQQVDHLAKSAGITGRYPCVLSGMITSAHGWKPLEYSEVPFHLSGESLTCQSAPSNHKNIEQLFFLSGVRTANDVMRGEETEVLGYFQFDEYKAYSDNATVVIPGTHSKHVHIQNNMMTDFKTYMTGEMFELLCTHSVLKFNVTREKSSVLSEFFLQGVQKSEDSQLLNSLFSVRTNDLFKAHNKIQNADYLSGLLVGNEVRALTEHTGKIMLYAKGQLLEMYKEAINAIGLGKQLLCIDTAKVASIYGHKVFLDIKLGKVK